LSEMVFFNRYVTSLQGYCEEQTCMVAIENETMDDKMSI